MDEMDSRPWPRQCMAGIDAPNRERAQRAAVRKPTNLDDGETHRVWKPYKQAARTGMMLAAFIKVDALGGCFYMNLLATLFRCMLP